jgi:hypothetical protein
LVNNYRDCLTTLKTAKDPICRPVFTRCGMRGFPIRDQLLSQKPKGRGKPQIAQITEGQELADFGESGACLLPLSVARRPAS